MSKKTNKKKASIKKSDNSLVKFVSTMTTSKKIIYVSALLTVISATVLLILIRNQFSDSGWYTSNWLYIAYLSLLLLISFILISYKSLFKLSRLPIAGILLMVFLVSGMLSVDYYKYYLDLTSPVEFTETTGSLNRPKFDDAIQESTVEPVQTNNNPAPNQQTQPNTNQSNDEWYSDFERRQKEADAKYAEIQRCEDANNAAGDKYSAAIDDAQAAYDAVMADWEAVKNLPYYQRHPYEQYAADAKSKHNAISKPAYSTYVTTLDTLRSQGCNIIQTHSDYSW